MSQQTPQQRLSTRAGEQNRINIDRYFHVMSQGWYVHTREGIRGPFFDKHRADIFIKDIAKRQSDDPSSSWRL
jgi:hypothetical protein